MVTIAEMRELLGEDGQGLTDVEVDELIAAYSRIAAQLVEQFVRARGETPQKVGE